MGLTFAGDVAAADWLARSTTPWDQLVGFGPEGFPAYGRLRFIPDPTGAGQHEADVDLPEDRPSDLDRCRRALRVLAAFTATPGDCWFCVWEGYSDIPLPTHDAAGPWVVVPHRRYALLHGRLTDVDEWETLLGGGFPIAPPAFAWPADRSWVFASDVDPHWAGIAASVPAIAALLADPTLDVVTADPRAKPPAYR